MREMSRTIDDLLDASEGVRKDEPRNNNEPTEYFPQNTYKIGQRITTIFGKGTVTKKLEYSRIEVRFARGCKRILVENSPDESDIFVRDESPYTLSLPILYR
jgi:hypothetical protein